MAVLVESDRDSIASYNPLSLQLSFTKLLDYCQSIFHLIFFLPGFINSPSCLSAALDIYYPIDRGC